MELGDLNFFPLSKVVRGPRLRPTVITVGEAASNLTLVAKYLTSGNSIRLSRREERPQQRMQSNATQS